jgi:hypothetical protein
MVRAPFVLILPDTYGVASKDQPPLRASVCRFRGGVKQMRPVYFAVYFADRPSPIHFNPAPDPD